MSLGLLQRTEMRHGPLQPRDVLPCACRGSHEHPPGYRPRAGPARRQPRPDGPLADEQLGHDLPLVSRRDRLGDLVLTGAEFRPR